MQIGLEDSFPPKVDYFQGQIGLPSSRVSGYCAQPLSQISHLMGKPQRNQSWVVKPCVLSLNLIMFVMGIYNDKIHYVSLYYHSHNFCHYIFILSTLWDIADSTKSSEKYPEAMSAEETLADASWSMYSDFCGCIFVDPVTHSDQPKDLHWFEWPVSEFNSSAAS